MALVTVALGQAGQIGGAAPQFVASATYDDATGIIQSLSTTLLSGTAAIVWDGNRTFPVAPGTTSRDVSALNRNLNKAWAISFQWGP